MRSDLAGAGLAAFVVALFVVAFVLDAPASAQGNVAPACESAQLNLIFQRAPSSGPHAESSVPFDGAVERVRVESPLGQRGRTRVWAGIVSRLPGTAGASSWAVQTRVRGDVSIVDATVAGTVAAPRPDGLVTDGFVQLRMPTLRNEPGFYCAVLLSFSDPVTLRPVGTSTFVEFTLESRAPQGEAVQRGLVDWVDGCTACQTPFVMSATVSGATRHFCSRPTLDVEFAREPAGPARAAFVRCDVNDDGRLTVTDAAAIVNAIFLSGPRARCRDTEDCDGTGSINLTDAVYGLESLFSGGPPPPAPFPACGKAAVPLSADSCPPGSTACP